MARSRRTAPLPTAARRADASRAATRWTAAAAAALLLATLDARAGEDDERFARELSARGYSDLAARVLETMSGEQASLARFQIAQREAGMAAGDPRNDPAVVRTKFQAAIASGESVLSGLKEEEKRVNAEAGLARLMQQFGLYLQENADRFPASEKEAVRKESERQYEEAVRRLTTMRDRWQAKLNEANAVSPATDESQDLVFLATNSRDYAWLFLCQALQGKALLHPVGDAMRVTHLGKAIEESQTFLEETDGTVAGLWAALELGKSYRLRAQKADGWDAEDVRQAREWLMSPIGEAEAAAQNQAAANALCEALLTFGEMCNAVGTVGATSYPKLLVEACLQVEQKFPGIRTSQKGLMALIEKAKALAATGLHEAAVRDLNGISNAATQADPRWGRGVDQAAKRALNGVIASVPPDSGVTLSAEVLFKAAEGSKQDGKFALAIRGYQRVLLGIEMEADEARRKGMHREYFTQCWYNINYCYSALDRHREAFLAADQAVQDYLAAGRTDEDQDVGACANYRITALQGLERKTKDPAVAEEIKKARELFTQKFSWWEGGQDQVYIEASQKLAEGYRLLAQDKEDAGKARFSEGVELLKKVADNKPTYRLAQARIGEALVNLDRLDEAIAHLDAFQKRNAAFFTNPSTPGSQRQPMGIALFWAATAHERKKAPDKVLQALDGFEKRLAGASMDNFFPRVVSTRVDAYLALDKTTEAEAEALRLQKEFPEAAFTPRTSLAVATKLYAAFKAKEATDPEAATALRGRALSFYDWWLRRASADAKTFSFVGKEHLALGNMDRAAACFEAALDMFRKEKNPDGVLEMTVNLATILVSQGKFAEALPRFEDLFVKGQADLENLRAFFDALKMRPATITPEVFAADLAKSLKAIVEIACTEDAAAGLKATADAAAARGDTEALLRAFDQSPATRRALARGAALQTLGLPAVTEPVRNTAFGLVQRSPDLMSGLARCYEELAGAKTEYPFRAISIYNVLILAAPLADVEPGQALPENAKYSARWFDWRYRHARVFLRIGVTAKHEDTIRTVCHTVKSMEALEEIPRADAAQAGLGKKFLELRDQASSELQKIGKEGCK